MPVMLPQLQLFGPPALWVAGQRHSLPASAPTWLLAALGLAGDWLSREQLQLLFWPDAPAADAQRQLRVTLHRSRQLLQAVGAEDALVAERTRLRLALGCDVAQFHQALARGDWAAVCQLHQQPLLGGQTLRGFAELDDWLARQRESLQAAWRAAALREAAALEAAGQAGPAVALLQQQLQHDLLAEDAVQALLRLAAQAGERVAALALFERFKLRAAEELGLPPLPATLALADALRRELPVPPPAAPAAAGAGPRLPPVLQQLPLLGRAEELAWLQRAGGGLRVLAGEPGLGKTRLLAEALPGATWVRGRESLRQAPLLALSQALASHRATLTACVASPRDRLALARLWPELADGTHLPPVEPGSHELRDALVRVLLAWPQPLVLDDLQWLDDASLQVVAQALAQGARGWAASLRPAEWPVAQRAWLDSLEVEGRAERLDLPAWPDTAIAALTTRLAGRPVPGFTRWLALRCGGNPFFVLETVSSLSDEGRLAGPDGQPSALENWPDEAAPAVPPRVAQVLRRRLAHLSDAAQRVLGIAAVAGDAHALDTLAELAGLSPWATAEALAQAQDAGLMAGRQFAHDLVRQMLLVHTPEPLRAVLHAGVARRLAAVLPPHVLAEHWWAAAQWAPWLEASLAAAMQDGDLGLSDIAVQRLQDTLQRLDKLQAMPNRPGDLEPARVHLALAKIERQREAMDAVERHAQAALSALPGPATRQGALMELFEVAILRGQLSPARQCLEEARALNPDLPTLAMDEAKLAHAEGDAEGVVRHAGRFLAWLRTQPPSVDLAVALTSQACGYDLLGQGERSLALQREALAVARRLKARHAEVEVLNNLVCTLGELGRDDEAVALALPALADGDGFSTFYLRNNVVSSLLALGRLDEAELHCRAVLAVGNPNTNCAAAAKLLTIAARRHAPPAEQAAAADAVLAAIAGTDVYVAQVIGIVALLEHGDDTRARAARAWLRESDIYPSLQQRLMAALAARGWALTCPA